ncbi:MAG: hypothetical protein ACXWT0_11400, partial [Methylobacter sp.]
MNTKLWLVACSVVLFLSCSDDTTFSSSGNEASSVVTLDQGWSKDEELDFYNTSQGSQLLPYSWFLALEQASNSDLFRNDKNIRRLG